MVILLSHDPEFSSELPDMRSVYTLSIDSCLQRSIQNSSRKRQGGKWQDKVRTVVDRLPLLFPGMPKENHSPPSLYSWINYIRLFVSDCNLTYRYHIYTGKSFFFSFISFSVSELGTRFSLLRHHTLWRWGIQRRYQTVKVFFFSFIQKPQSIPICMQIVWGIRFRPP